MPQKQSELWGDPSYQLPIRCPACHGSDDGCEWCVCGMMDDELFEKWKGSQ